MELSSSNIDLALPLNGSAKACIVEQALDTFLFTLQQLPATIAQLRKWKQELQAAEACYVEQTGRLAPRSLTRKRALSFLASYDSLLAALRLLLCGAQAEDFSSSGSSQAQAGEEGHEGGAAVGKEARWHIHSVLLLLGPNIHNPKQAFHITYNHHSSPHTGVPQPQGAPAAQGAQGEGGRPGMPAVRMHEGVDTPARHSLPFKFPAARLPPPTVADDCMGMSSEEEEGAMEEGEADMEEDDREGEAALEDPMPHSVPTTSGVGTGDDEAGTVHSHPTPYPCPYPCPPLPAATANALARKVARTLITESVKLCGLRGLGPQKLILIVQAAPCVPCTSTTPSATLSTDEDASSLLLLPHGWLPRPNFSLKLPVKLVKAGSRGAPCVTSVSASSGAGLGPVLGPLSSLHGSTGAEQPEVIAVPQGWVPLNHSQAGEVYKLSVIRVTGLPATADMEGEAQQQGQAGWYQCTHLPQGFRDRLPAHPKPKPTARLSPKDLTADSGMEEDQLSMAAAGAQG